MATQHEKLAASLRLLKATQDRGARVIRAAQHKALTRVHRERLMSAGFLKPAVAGWYVLSRPDESAGDTTSWYASMEAFVAAYAQSRFGRAWQLPAEQSLMQHSGETTLSRQFQIHAPKANNQVVQLPHGCSLFLYRVQRASLAADAVVTASGLRLLPLEHCLFRVVASFYERQPQAAQIALRRADINVLARLLLKDGATTVAARLIGALQAVGRKEDAKLLQATMQAAGHKLRANTPFVAALRSMAGERTESPYVQRIRLMWAEMRDDVVHAFRAVPSSLPRNIDSFMADVQSRYVTDAYNSLSIEGYQVTEALIDKVRHGDWRPDFNSVDRAARDAMAAKGYFEAHKQVLSLIRSTLQRRFSPGKQLRNKLAPWHLALFSPSVTAGIVTAQDLAGYRNRPVFIAGALHVPPPSQALMECMPVLMELLEKEDRPAVRAVLGHVVFVFIHPYIDGNGRLGRFIMNYMLATGGFVWTVVPVLKRAEYMAALEQASTQRNIKPLALMLARLVAKSPARADTRSTTRNTRP